MSDHLVVLSPPALEHLQAIMREFNEAVDRPGTLGKVHICQPGCELCAEINKAISS